MPRIPPASVAGAWAGPPSSHHLLPTTDHVGAGTSGLGGQGTLSVGRGTLPPRRLPLKGRQILQTTFINPSKDYTSAKQSLRSSTTRQSGCEQ